MTLDISLYGILDPQIARGRRLTDLASLAARGGASILQYRAKRTDTRAMIAEAREIHAALRGTGVPLLINDRVDVALAVGAEGVHLGQQDMHPADARAVLGQGAIIGATVKSLGDLEELAGTPINYACIGGVFATAHKDNPDPPLGIERFRVLRESARRSLGDIPVGAIAGVTADNAASLMEVGADGVAVIGSMFADEDVLRATALLAQTVARARAART
ncbi:ThiE Thiamine monophosphate synthase [Rhabdaerophilaceae bacterium]